jgi:hypothetical protein
MIFAHSGALGDIVYALPVIKHYGPGELHVKLNNIPNTLRKYGNGPVDAAYEGRLSQADYSLIAPLLEAQPYITKVRVYDGAGIHYDLDRFRATVGPEFKTNFIEVFCQTFKIPYSIDESFKPWLTVRPNPVAKVVVTRTARYQSNKTSTIPTWLQVLRENKVEQEGVFIGLPAEHEAFQELFNVTIPYYKCRDFLDMAEVIAGAETFCSNQTFAYSVAQGLGKRTILETLSWRPLAQNECYFPRPDCFYF